MISPARLRLQWNGKAKARLTRRGRNCMSEPGVVLMRCNTRRHVSKMNLILKVLGIMRANPPAECNLELRRGTRPLQTSWVLRYHDRLPARIGLPSGFPNGLCSNGYEYKQLHGLFSIRSRVLLPTVVTTKPRMDNGQGPRRDDYSSCGIDKDQGQPPSWAAIRR